MTRGIPSAQAPVRVGLMLVGLALGAWGMGGCAAHRATVVEHGRTEAGLITMDASARRNLSVLEHRCRRDRLGRLSVLMRFGNTSGEAFLAWVRVRFRDRDGTWEQGADRADDQKFPPGESVMECTSYSQNAVGYEVQIRSRRFFLW